MMIANGFGKPIERIYETLRSMLERAIDEERDKRYVQTLAELTSFLSILKNFVNSCAYLDTVYRDIKYGRICGRWIYTENVNNNIALVKLNPRTVISSDGLNIKVSYKNRTVILSGGELRLTINNYNDVINLNDENNVVQKRSLILNVVGSLKSHINHVTNDFIMCSKFVKQQSR